VSFQPKSRLCVYVPPLNTLMDKQVRSRCQSEVNSISESPYMHLIYMQID
jgi:hypothetical protein